MEVIKRNGSVVTFDVDKIVKAIERAIRSDEPREIDPKIVRCVENFLIEYECLTEESKDEALDKISNQQLNEMQSMAKNIMKMIETFEWDDWYKIYQMRVIKNLHQKIKRALRKRWLEANIVAIKKIQFKQFAKMFMKKGIAILSNPALRSVLDIIKIVFEINKLLPKCSKRKSFKVVENQTF